MRRLVIVPLLALLAQACLFGGGADQRTILVDFSHDEFASFFIHNFPEEVSVRPGTTLVFRQTWTGEPHTVTGGTEVNTVLAKVDGWDRFFDAFDALEESGAALPSPENPGDDTVADFAAAVNEAEDAEARSEALASWEALREAGSPLPDLADPGDMSFADLVELVDAEFAGGLPWALDEDEDGGFYVTQNGGRPCYLTEGLPPEDPNEPCESSEQPVFDGTHTYYNSGIIPFEGQQGNTYRVPLADDLEPGAYTFYCAVHGSSQATTVKVVEQGADVSTQDEITREARAAIDEISGPLEDLWDQANSEGSIEVERERVEGPFAGLFTPEADHAGINEFVPNQMTVKAGEPITWKLMGADHSISFDVPSYFPVVEFMDDGTVRLNPQLRPPAGGAPEMKPEDEEGDGPPRMDGGTYDGEGFWSSGLVYGDPYLEYTLRISKPGTYRYACLLHPPMVGTVEVTA